MIDTTRLLSSYGAIPDARHLYLVTIEAGSDLLDHSAGGFVLEDVGKSITISGAGGPDVVLSTTVAAFISPTQVRLATPAAADSAAIPHQSALIGTDCGPALQDSFQDAWEKGGGKLVIDGQFALRSPVAIDWMQAGETSRVEAFVIEGNGSASCLHIAVAPTQDAIRSANGNVLIRDLNFAGLMGAIVDARNVISFYDASLSLENVGFYGLRGADDGHVIYTTFSDFYANRFRFGGCSGNSATDGSVVKHDNWSAINMQNGRFIDYGFANKTYYSKTGIRSARAWISVGDDSASSLQALKSSVLRLTNLKLDEGAMRAIEINPPTRQIDRVVIDGAEVNGWGSAQAIGIYAKNVRDLSVLRSSFGLTTFNGVLPAVVANTCEDVKVDAVQCNSVMRRILAQNVKSLTVRNSPTLDVHQIENVRDFRLVDGDRVTNYPRLVASRASPGSFQTIGAAFTTIAFGAAVTDTHAAWDPTTNVYTVPEAGTYDVVAALRVADNGPVNVNFGMGVDTVNADRTGFVWSQTPPAAANGTVRLTVTHTRTLRLEAGAPLRMFAGVFDYPAGLGVKAAELTITRIA